MHGKFKWTLTSPQTRTKTKKTVFSLVPLMRPWAKTRMACLKCKVTVEDNVRLDAVVALGVRWQMWMRWNGITQCNWGLANFSWFIYHHARSWLMKHSRKGGSYAHIILNWDLGNAETACKLHTCTRLSWSGYANFHCHPVNQLGFATCKFVGMGMARGLLSGKVNRRWKIHHL